MNEKGFTLVEVIIALVLVGIIAVSFIPVLSGEYVNIYKTGDKSQATYKASERIENKVSSIKQENPKGKEITQTDREKEEFEANKKGENSKYSDIKIEFETETGPKKIDAVVETVGSKADGDKKQETTELKVGIPVKIKK